MGYRSEVKILVRGETSMVQTFKILWYENVRDLKVGYDGHQAISPDDCGEVTVYGKRAEWLLEFSDVKWYDHYVDVQAYEKIIDDCPDELYAELVRVGEDTGDIEHRFGGRGDEDPAFYTHTHIARY